jgi:hypothetical protein
MVDRLDLGFMREENKRLDDEWRSAREAAGPLLSATQKTKIMATFSWMGSKEAEDVLDTVSYLAGERGPNDKPNHALDILKQALSDHVSGAFLKNNANFTAAASVLTAALEEREERIAAGNAGKGPGASTAAKTGAGVKTPGKV